MMDAGTRCWLLGTVIAMAFAGAACSDSNDDGAEAAAGAGGTGGTDPDTVVGGRANDECADTGCSAFPGPCYCGDDGGTGGVSAGSGGTAGADGGDAGSGGAATASDPCPLDADLTAVVGAREYGADAAGTFLCRPRMVFFGSGTSVSGLYEDEASLRSAFECDESSKVPVDFDTERVFVVVIPERTGTSLAWAGTDGSAITVTAKAPAYCGGAAPPTEHVVVVLPKGPESITGDVCRYGKCDFDGGLPPGAAPPGAGG